MASDPRVLRYIREQMNAGFRKPEIYNALLEAGWYKEEIDQAFYEVANEIYGTTEPTPPPQAYPVKDVPQKPGFFWKFKNSLFHPGRLFDAIKSEEGFRGSLAFFGVIYFINIVITISVLFFASNVIDNLIKSELFSQLFQLMVFISMVNILDPLNILITYGFAFIATILGAGLIHIFVYIFGGRKGFHQTYKALMYSTAPSILFGVFLMLWVFVLPLSPEYILFAISLFLIPILWSLIIAIKGVSKLQEISGFRAAMGILTLPLIIFGILFLFSFGVFNPSTYVARTATGFAEIGHPQDWAYNYEGDFQMVIKNQHSNPITIQSVSVNCGINNNLVYLTTTDPTTVRPQETITYSTGTEKCVSKEPGESYSVSVTIRYLDVENNIPKQASGQLTGNII